MLFGSVEKLFTSNGTSGGVVTVDDNSLFYVNALVYVVSTTQPRLDLMVTDLIGSTQFRVRNIYTATFVDYRDISAYLVADGARIVRPLAEIADPGTAGGGGGPTGPAGGDLSGTYPNPAIAAGAVIASKIGVGASATNVGSLGGDLSGTLPSPTVASIGGSSASAVHTGELLANAATAANTASTIVRRDGSGNFIAGTITAALTGTASGNPTLTPSNHGVVISGSGQALTVLTPVSSTTKVLTSGGLSADPSWADIPAGLLSPLTTKGDLWGWSTTNARLAVGTNTWVLVADSSQTLGIKWSALDNSNLSGSAGITNANLATMSAHTYKGNNTGSSGVPVDVTSTQLTADLNVFTSSLQGLVPSSGGGSTNFLRADGTFAIPAGTGITALTGDVTASGSGSVAATVAKINGALLGTTTASNGNLLIANGSQWNTEALSGDGTITNAGVLTVTKTNGVAFTSSATTANASINTVSTLVLRDGSGNFAAGTITAALTGTASGNTAYTANNHGVVISGSGNTMTVIAPDASTAKVLTSGGASADPTWSNAPALSGANFSAASVPNSALANGAVANLSGTNSGDVTLAAVGSSPSAKAATIASQVLTLQPFDGTHPGVVTASGGGTTNFLRADGAWAAASGTGITALTGDVTASGTGSVAATVAFVGGSSASLVHSAELLANAATAANTASVIVKRTADKNTLANNAVSGYATTVTAGGTTILTVASAYCQVFTGSSTQIVRLPDATQVTQNGHTYRIVNKSTGTLTVQDSGTAVIATLITGTEILFTANDITSPTAWIQSPYLADNTHPGLVVGSSIAQTLGGLYTFPNVLTVSGASNSNSAGLELTGSSTNYVRFAAGGGNSSSYLLFGAGYTPGFYFADANSNTFLTFNSPANVPYVTGGIAAWDIPVGSYNQINYPQVVDTGVNIVISDHADIEAHVDLGGRIVDVSTPVVNSVYLTTVSITHAVTATITNPLGNNTPPKQVLVYPGIRSILSYSWTFAAATNQINLTVNYDVGDQFVLLSSTTSQSIPNGAETIYINFPASPTVSLGTNITYDGSSKLTAAVTGLYDVRVSTPFTTTGPGMRFIAILVNSSIRWAAVAYACSPADGTYCATSAIIPLSAGDFVQMDLFQDSGGTLSNNPSTSFACRMEMRQLSQSGVSDTPTIFVTGY